MLVFMVTIVDGHETNYTGFMTLSLQFIVVNGPRSGYT